MAIEITIPDVGADEVEITEIMVAPGDSIEPDQPLLTVEGDKAAMEVPAEQAGTVKELKVQVGDKVTTGTLMMILEASGDETKTEEAVPTPEKQADSEVLASSIVPVAVPDIGGDPVEVTEIMVAVGDSVEEEQALITVEGDKASMEVPAPMSGIVKSISIELGAQVATGDMIMEFEVAGAADAPSAEAPEPVTESAPPAKAPQAARVSSTASPATSAGFEENSAYAYATPVIRRLARELGVDLSKVSGTGRKQRILKQDVYNYVKQAMVKVQSGEPTGDAGGRALLPWPKVDFAKFGEVEHQPLSRINKIAGANLSRNWAVIPHVTQFDQADITELEAFRKEQNVLAAKLDSGVKITPLVFIMKAVAKALAEMPRFNSSLSEDGEQLILKKYIHIGVAVDTPNGLVVPVVRDADQKGIQQLSAELAELSVKARQGKLTTSEMQGGCFSISSLGGIGGTAFTPIVNAPEVAILGVSKAAMQPTWNGSEFAPRLMMPLSLSYDHRVIDGADGARFTALVSSYLSDIRRLVL